MANDSDVKPQDGKWPDPEVSAAVNQEVRENTLTAVEATQCISEGMCVVLCCTESHGIGLGV